MQPGDVVDDRFLIEGVAGTGGMGIVYRARDQRRQEPVALKMLRGANAVTKERFYREARVLRELQHPGIVRHIAQGVTKDGALYLAMEWLDGEDLKERLLRSGLDVADSVAILLGAAQALVAAHAMGVVHRDIKPSNLFLVGGDPHKVKVLDFGVAHDGDATNAAGTETGVVLGTVGYMAPEQVSSSSEATTIDARADVFSLGCVFFECLTGQRAFQGADLVAALAKILFQDSPRVSELRSDIPEELDLLVARMIAKNAADRPADAAQVAAELQALGAVVDSRRAPTTAAVHALTQSEQRLVCFVLGDSRDRSPDEDATISPIVERQRMGRFRAAIEPFKGARLELLQDGSLVVTLTGSGAATDLAAQAARCALALRALLPSAPMVLTTGRGEVRGRLPMGQVIDLAANLLQIARAHGGDGEGASRSPIRLDETTAGLLDVNFDVGGDQWSLMLRGEREHEATRTLLGRPTSCVGRERELAALVSYFDECASEPCARTVLVTAPAGVGKSRLRYEFLRSVRGRAEVWMGRGDPVSAGSAFGLLAQTVRRAAGLQDGEPPEVRRTKIRARVARHVPAPDVARVSEFLGEIVGAEFPDDGSVQLRAARQDMQLMGDQKRRAWEEFLAAECSAHPVVLVLEDLHWGDVPTIKLVDAALRSLHDRPFFVLALARPEVHQLFPKLWQDRKLQEIRLEELKSKASAKLAREVLGDRTSDSTIARIVERAGGNAFYLEELIRAVAEGHGAGLPETVLAMVQARLESLETEARRVLRAASIFGQTFWLGGIDALLQGAQGMSQVDGWLRSLAEREIIVRRPSGRFKDEPELVFRHALVREAAYAMLTEEDRVLGHRLAGEWLEHIGERDAAVLAEHYEQGRERDKSIQWHVRGAEQALEGNDLEAVLHRAERGVARGAKAEARGTLRLLQSEAHAWRGENAEAERSAIEAAAFLVRGTDGWFRATAKLVDSSTRLGHHDRALAAVEDLLAAAQTSLSNAQLVAVSEAVFPMVICGRYERAAELMRLAESAAAARPDLDPLLAAHVARAASWFVLTVGDLGGCLLRDEAAAASFERAGDRRAECQAKASLGAGCVLLGLYDEAALALKDALDVAETMGNHRTAAHAAQSLGLALGRKGDPEQAIVHLSISVQAYRDQGDLRYEGFSRIYLSQALALANELPRATDEAKVACAVVETFPPVHVYALANFARILSKQHRADEALATARRAMALFESLGSIEEGEEELRLAYAEALHATGDAAGARDAIAIAREQLLLRAAKISVPKWRASFLANVEPNARILALAEEWR